jgi:hypothetical protein
VEGCLQEDDVAGPAVEEVKVLVGDPSCEGEDRFAHAEENTERGELRRVLARDGRLNEFLLTA